MNNVLDLVGILRRRKVNARNGDGERATGVIKFVHSMYAETAAERARMQCDVGRIDRHQKTKVDG